MQELYFPDKIKNLQTKSVENLKASGLLQIPLLVP